MSYRISLLLNYYIIQCLLAPGEGMHRADLFDRLATINHYPKKQFVRANSFVHDFCVCVFVIFFFFVSWYFFGCLVYVPRKEIKTDWFNCSTLTKYSLHTKGEVAQWFSNRVPQAQWFRNQARGVQPACTMTTQNSKIRLISSIALFKVKVDNLVINLLLANFIGQFKLVVVQHVISRHPLQPGHIP